MVAGNATDERPGDHPMCSDETPEYRRVWTALSTCPPLTQSSPERDLLWTTVRDLICTRSQTLVTPLGSTRPVRVTSEYAGDELVAAMGWLYSHEDEARLLAPVALFRRLRGVATRGANGSGRAAQSDALCGLTAVAAGRPVRWTDIENWGAA